MTPQDTTPTPIPDWAQKAIASLDRFHDHLVNDPGQQSKQRLHEAVQATAKRYGLGYVPPSDWLKP